MEIIKDVAARLFAGRTARRIHKAATAVALLVTWSFFGTVNNVMHVSAFATMLFWIALADFSACIVFGAWDLAQIPVIEKSDAPAVSDKDDMEKAA